MSKIVPLLEKLFGASLLVGITISVLNSEKNLVIDISLMGLAVAFFLRAYAKIEPPEEDSEPMGFNDLFRMAIAPKILWISTSVATVGLLFYLQEFAGGKNMLAIGAASIAIASVVHLIISMSSKSFATNPVYFRSIPVTIAAVYVLFFCV